MKLLYIAIISISLAFIVFTWDKKPKRRRGDKRLNRHERKIYKISKNLIEKKQHVPAAKLLESIGLQRNAIDTLERAGYIDEAANILVRMKLPHRAGVIFARAAMWDDASRCFKLANMSLEVARCEREKGEFKVAAEYFLKADHHSEAGKCYLQAKMPLVAARNFLKCGHYKRAKKAYKQWLETGSRDIKLISSDELDIICEHALELPKEPLKELVENRVGTVHQMIRLLRVEKFNVADNLYQIVDKMKLLADAKLKLKDKHKDARLLINFYKSVGEPTYAKALSGIIGDSVAPELLPSKKINNDRLNDFSMEELECLQRALDGKLGRLENTLSVEVSNRIAHIKKSRAA